MIEPPIQSLAPRRALLPFAFWTLIALCFTGQFYISSAQIGRPILWRQALIYSLADWYVFAVLSFIPVQLTRRWNLESPQWLRCLGVHLVASVFFSAAYIALRGVVTLWHGAPDGRVIGLREAVSLLTIKTWYFNLLIYWVVASVTHALDYYRKFQERSVRMIELERSLAQAKLQALQMQLNPHFLFNSLNAIAELVHTNPDGAERMITRLSGLLRAALDSSDTQQVPLQRELELVRRYLDLEQVRFGPRLTVDLHIPEDALDVLVPSLILQPLVENAIRHGIEAQSRPGLIQVKAVKEPGELELVVADNGAGLPPGGLSREGIGLSNTRARLRELYQDRFTLAIEGNPGGGCRVRIRIPAATSTDHQTP
ncbi:MAG: histidine kinase [Verrucomicrobia bacterium]|nr:histidine kinase [Verrucomicrobiota bacterium]MBI3870495.1 histidine kinase [Verrucomicrobiota bacterium]